MAENIPTMYTAHGPPTEEDDRLVPVRVPSDVADELTLVTLWLSVRLEHRLPVPVLLRAIMLGGLVHAGRVLAELHASLARPDKPVASNGE